MKSQITFKKISGSQNKVFLVKGDPREDREKDSHNWAIPDDQLELSENDIKEEHARILTVSKHKPLNNIVAFSYKEKKFIQIPQPDDSHIYLNIVGNQICKDSEEARVYEVELKNIEKMRKNYYAKNLIDEYVDLDGNPRFRILKNKFNFSERLVQTYNRTNKEVSTQTDPPKKLTLSDNVTPYNIYLAYLEHAELLKKTLKGKKQSHHQQMIERMESARRKRAPKQSELQEQKANELLRMHRSVKIIERMLCQNSFEEVIDDFKYWDDESDLYSEEGSLLPLWKFTNKISNKMCITSICWNQKYTDLFAVSTGSYDFFKKTRGMIILYSLKIPSNFEFKIETSTGCMCVDFHPEYPYLIAAGFYDGSVCVYDLKYRFKKNNNFCITCDYLKHTNPVWQVRWQLDDADDNKNFTSISSDGRIINWTVNKIHLVANELECIKIKPSLINKKIDDIESLNSGTCFDFNSTQKDLFIVGTEDGCVHEYSTLYKNEVLTTFDSHTQCVYTIKWNPYFKRIFITCSADWTIKIWDHRYKNPIFDIQLSSPVSDVDWSPYSSTVFAAVTIDGYIYIYDLQISSAKALCVQNLGFKRKRKLTHISFNPVHPILLVSDEKGTVMSFKLSPNLRSIQKDSRLNSISILNKQTFEVQKIKDVFLKEMDYEDELVETTRTPFDFDKVKTSKTFKNYDDYEEDEQNNKNKEFKRKLNNSAVPIKKSTVSFK